jgi:hypothetical protein
VLVSKEKEKEVYPKVTNIFHEKLKDLIAAKKTSNFNHCWVPHGEEFTYGKVAGRNELCISLGCSLGYRIMVDFIQK